MRSGPDVGAARVLGMTALNLARHFAGLILLACVTATPAQAAESYDNCSGFITGVTGTSDVDGEAEGILFNGYAGLIRGNYIASVLPGAGIANGIKSNVGYLSIVEQNVILNPSATAGRGIDVNAVSTRPVCLNNRVRNFTVSAYDTCIDGGGNFSN